MIPFLIIVLVLILLYIIYYMIEYRECSVKASTSRTIEKDGFTVFYCPDHLNIHSGPRDKLVKKTLEKLPKDYVFIDYVYKINNAALSTFHRDVTSSQQIYDTTYPTYTLILYKYDGCLLSLCPGSHASYPFVNSNIVNFHGKAGTCFLFNCDILHAGCLNHCKYREVIQYKLCHNDDYPKLIHLHRINAQKDEKCRDNFYVWTMRKLSYFFEFPINYIFYPFMMKKHEGILGKIQEYIPLGFYNNA